MKISARLVICLLNVMAATAMTGCNRIDQPPDLERAMALREAIGGGAVAESPEDGGAPMAEPIGWGTFKGRFTLDGSPPAKVQLEVKTDREVCAPGGRPVFGEEVVIGDDGGIRNVLVFLNTKISSEEPWTHPSVKPGVSGEVIFDQKECRFLTHVIAMQAGQTLRILNSDPVGHNTKIENTPINRIVSSGGEISYQPEDEWKSPSPVSCSIHPWMSAYMLVRENGYFAVTDDNGNFEIPNLPAGIELEFRIWQEKAKFLSGVEINGQTVKKGRYSVTLPKDGDVDLQVTLNASLFN